MKDAKQEMRVLKFPIVAIPPTRYCSELTRDRHADFPLISRGIVCRKDIYLVIGSTEDRHDFFASRRPARHHGMPHAMPACGMVQVISDDRIQKITSESFSHKTQQPPFPPAHTEIAQSQQIHR